MQPVISRVKVIKLRHLLLIISLALTGNLYGEIHRETSICKESGELCFHWWPELPEIKGWQQDKPNSFQLAVNVQVPVGFNFTNAESIIYAKAIYKLRRPETKNINQLITEDKQSFLERDPTLTIKEVSEIKTASGKNLRRFTFSPIEKGNWEMVSYGEENDEDNNEYYLLFILSSKSEEDFKNTLSIYETLLSQYQ